MKSVMGYKALVAAPKGGEAAPAPGGGQQRPPAPFLVSFMPFLIIILIFYFLIIRPQQKQQKETQKMLAALKKGDRVVTAGGLHGTIIDFKEQEKVVTLEVAPNVRVNVNRSAVSSVKREGQLPPQN